MILGFFAERLADAVSALGAGGDDALLHRDPVVMISERGTFLVEELVVTRTGSTHLHGSVVVFSGRRP